MKTFVINLPSRVDRRETFIANNPHLTDIQWFAALDGRQCTLANIKELGFTIDSAWRDPFNNRKLTKGEVGCFVSHYFLWKLCVNLNEPILILEDDAIVSQEDLNLPLLFLDANFHIDSQQKWDLLYLGYNENSNDTPLVEYEQDPRFVYPVYPYNSHAYIICPSIAKYLLSRNQIIPVDELLAKTVKDFTVIAYKDSKAQQVSRSILSSDVEPRDESDYFPDYNAVHVLTAGTDRKKSVILNDSGAKYGIYPKNLGNNVVWEGGDMTSTGGMQKLHLLYDYITQHTQPEDIVLFTDAYDVFYASNLETIVNRYMGFGPQILFGAEKFCWPDKSLEQSYPTSHTIYRYLNSGCFIGRAGTLRELLDGTSFMENCTGTSFMENCKQYSPSDDDQFYLTKLFLSIKDPKIIDLDREQYIFAVGTDARVYGPSLTYQLYNPLTNCTSCIYHGAGPPSSKTYMNNLYANFAPPTDFAYIPSMSPIQYMTSDMLVVDFLTQSQCEHLIEMAEQVGSWQSLDFDAYPAQEIRLKKLGLYETFAKRWEEHIFPIVEKHWFPLKMHGLRDAFVMKYTADTQKSLALHHDASLVTGSVKLNEDYVGGVLDFPRQKVTNFNVPVGKCILFPGQVTYPHQSLELLSGTKYSLTMWTARHPGDFL